MNRLLGTLGLAVALGGATAAMSPREASADVSVRIGGHVRVGGPRVYVRHWRPYRPYYRPYYRPPVVIGGTIWLGGGYYYERPFAQPPPPPPPPPPCDCGPQYYPPIAPAPAGPAVVAVTPVEERLPRFGIGAFVGGVSVEGEHEGEDVGLVGQIRLARPLLIEGEVAKNTLEDGSRIDRRLLIGVNLELGAHRKLAPYLTAGIGTSQVKVEGGWEDSQAIAEIGVGLRLRLSNHLALFGDIRAGGRESVHEDEPVDYAARSTSTVMPDDDGEEYSRLRLGGMFTF